MGAGRDANDVPVWLLDIDGVINAVAREPVPGSWPADQWVRVLVPAQLPELGAMVFPILAARPVLEFVSETVRTRTAQVYWHSTWREAAVTDLAPVLGLPDIPVSDAPEWDDRPQDLWWKLPAARRVVGSGRRLVWTDDDIAEFPSDVEDLRRRQDTLLISPPRSIGLGPTDLRRITTFLAAGRR